MTDDDKCSQVKSAIFHVVTGTPEFSLWLGSVDFIPSVHSMGFIAQESDEE